MVWKKKLIDKVEIVAFLVCVLPILGVHALISFSRMGIFNKNRKLSTRSYESKFI